MIDERLSLILLVSSMTVAIVFLVLWIRTRDRANQLSTKLQAQLELQEKTEALYKDSRSSLRESVADISQQIIADSNKQILSLAATQLNHSQSEARNDLELRKQAIEALLKPMGQTLDKVQTQLTAISTLKDSFADLSQKALNESNQQFLTLAKTQFEGHQNKAQEELNKRQQAISELLKPMEATLSKVQSQIGELETERQKTKADLSAQIKMISDSNRSLREETSKLSGALRSNSSRGRWGELQLKRVVELAGMVEYCDFEQQVASNDRTIRPDLVVHLPGNRCIIVDAKAPMDAYLQAVECDDLDSRAELMKRHAKHVKDHLTTLSSKSYYSQFDNTPEFVVMFLPGESLFQAALEADPTLIEYGSENRVILSTPTTLIALLRAVAYGWKQEQLADNARTISQMGSDLYDSCSTMASHFSNLGKSLNKSVDLFNDVLGSFENRVISRARKLGEMGVSMKKALPDQLPSIQTQARLPKGSE
jgi:DNA recombination protein RmuC